jgi:uncharacterized protein YxeA
MSYSFVNYKLTGTKVFNHVYVFYINYWVKWKLWTVIFWFFRYRKVCVPLGKQISHRAATYLCMVSLGTAVLISWPAPILYGHSSVNTTNPNITGTRCFTDDRYKDTKYQAYFNYVLILMFLVMSTILAILYSLIAGAISRHDKFIKTFKVSTRNPYITRHRITDSKKMAEDHRDEIVLKCVILQHDKNGNDNTLVFTDSSSASSSSDQHKHTKSRQKHHHEHAHFHLIKRTTFTMCLITVCFVVSYFPHLSLKIMVFKKPNFISDMNFSEKYLYNTFVWCFFINNIANSFIYGFFDKHFSAELRNMYSYILCRNKR